jgi:hypothetical protein
MTPPGIALEVQVGRDKKPPPRERARDKGTVTPLGIEVDTSLYDEAEKRRAARKWTKRTIWEEAMRRFLGKDTEEDDDDA